MDFKLSKEQLMLQKLFREFAEDEVKPIAADVDEEERFPEETVKKMAKLGMMGIYLPKQYGGAGADYLSYVMAVEELANVLGGVVGASRAVVDAGWIGVDHQVGQTGKTVHPKIYVALGISGAIQHLAGMQDSECIISVNKNGSAPIFDASTYGITGDLFKVGPMLAEAIKSFKAAKG